MARPPVTDAAAACPQELYGRTWISAAERAPLSLRENTIKAPTCARGVRKLLVILYGAGCKGFAGEDLFGFERLWWVNWL